MADPTEEQGVEHADSLAHINAAFAQAYEEVYGDETPEEGSEAGAEGAAAGAGAAPDPAAVEQGGQAPAAPAAGESGAAAAVPNAGDLPGVQTGAVDAAGAPAAGGEGATGGAATANGPVADPAATRSFADVSPLFDAAITGLNERAEKGFRDRALNDVREEVDPKYLEAIENHPRLLVGQTVPAANGQGTELIKDEADAASWQGAVKHIISQQVHQKTQAYLNDAKPFLGALQDSIEMFRRNPELVPGTKEFDREIATKFTALAASYKYEVDGKTIGYMVDVQPLIEAVKTQVAAARQAAPATPTARQEQAANQARNEVGQFEGPQAGIISQQGLSGEAEEDFTAFWGALNMPQMNI